MKKMIFRTIIASIALGISALTLSSCQDPIYYYVRKEVSLEDGSIFGQMQCLVRFNVGGTEKIFTSNGTIYSKDASVSSYGHWTKMNTPGQYIITMAADSNYIYALDGKSKKNSYEGENIIDNRSLYASTDGSNWTLVWNDISSDNSKEVVLFGTNACTKDRRHAYIRYNGTTYQLNGAARTALNNGSSTAQTTPTTNTKSCASLGDTTYFFNGYAAVSDKSEANIYYADGSDVKRMKVNGTGYTISGSVSGGTIRSLAVTGDSLLIGTTGGIAKYRRDNTSGDLGSSAGFDTNADSIFSGQYELRAMLCVDPSLAEKSATLYATMTFSGTGSNSAQFNHACIWAYYPSRGTWNRD